MNALSATTDLEPMLLQEVRNGVAFLIWYHVPTRAYNQKVESN